MAISDFISVLELFDLQHTFFVKGLITDLGLGFSTVQCVQVVNSTLWRRPRMSEDLEDVKIVAQRVSSDQQHTCS